MRAVRSRWTVLLAGALVCGLVGVAGDTARAAVDDAGAAVGAAAVVGLGTQTVGGSIDDNPAGLAEAFGATATTSGTVTSLSLYVDATSTATSALVGLYADSAGKPGALLTQATINAPVDGTWNTVTVPGASVIAGTAYWIGILGPTGAGTLAFRDVTGGAPSQNSAAGLSALPATWSAGPRWDDSPLSAYATVTPAGPSLAVAPASLSLGATVGGSGPPPATVSVSNGGSGTLSFAATSDQPWLTVTPGSGSAPQALTVTASIAGLAVGSYSGHLTVTAGGVAGSPTIVPVSLSVAAASVPGQGDWPTAGHDPGRSGTATDETSLGSANAAGLTPSWQVALDGKVTAQPLFLGGVQVSGATHDVVIAATNQNTLYALDATSGAVLWSRHLVAAPASCGVPGGLGITATPVADRSTGRIYAVTDDGDLRTISLLDGTDAAPALPLVADPATNYVWGGLTLVNGSLYVPTASDGCDDPPWQGGIIQLNVSGSTPQLVKHWITVPSLPAGQAGGGIWGFDGVSVDTSTGHVYAASSDDDTLTSGKEGYTPYAGSLIGLDAGLNLLGWYQPTIPANYTCGSAPPCDQDFASTPLVFHPAGCPTMLAAGNKNGQLYVTPEAALEADTGSDASKVQALALNATIDDLGLGGLYGTPRYSPATNLLYVSDTGPGVGGTAAGLVALAVQPDCSLKVAWSRAIGTGVSNSPNSPPTLANGVVYVGANDGTVQAFDAVTGTRLWSSASVGFAVYDAPIVAKGRVIAGTWTGGSASAAGTLQSWTVGSSPALAVRPAGLTFTATAGAGDPATQSVALTDTGAGSLSFTAASSPAWLSATPTSGPVPGSLVVAAHVAGLAAGTYTGAITVTPSQGTAATVAVSFTVDPAAPTVPGAPTGVRAVAGNASAQVSWTAPGTGGSPLTSYTVTPYTGGVAGAATVVGGNPPATSTTVPALVDGTPYTFTVTATNGVGTGSPSTPSAAVTPTAVAAASFVQQVSGRRSATSLTLTPSAVITAGDRLVVEVGIWGTAGAAVKAVTDSAGDTYTQLAAAVAADQTQLSVWSTPVTAGGGGRPTVTVTATRTGDIGAAAVEYAGLSTAAGSGAVDQVRTATGTTGSAAATVASGATAAGTAAGELAVGFYADSGFGDTLTAGSGWTQRVEVSPTGDMEFLVEDQVAAAGATPSASFGTGGSTPWAAAVVVLRHA